MLDSTQERCQSKAEKPIRLAKVDGHTAVAQSLKSLGATHVYGVAGTPIRETFAKCAQLGIRPLGVRHQQAGVMMALAQNYVIGKLAAVAIFSAGPAVTNAATGILVAKDNCWPMVVLAGRRPLSMRGMGSFQELDAVPIFQSITKWSVMVEKASEIPQCLQRAFQIALSGRPGPVYVELPEDVLNAMVPTFDAPALECSSCAANFDQTAISRAAEILLHAEHPALIIGKGIRWSEPYAELARLVNEFGIPFIASPMGRGYLPDDHPLCANNASGLLQRNADAILVAGARLDWTFRFGSQIARDAQIIQIDIHGSEIGTNRAATVGLVGDVRRALQEILTAMDLKKTIVPKIDLAPWHAALETEGKNRARKLDAQLNGLELPMSPQRMFKELKEFLPREGICVLDGNVSMAAGQQILPSYFPASRFTAGNNGCMGVGVPFAIGAKIARPDRFVIAICGDMGFGLGAMDLETAVRHKVPIVAIVVNNDGNTGAIMEKAYFPNSEERISMFQENIHYEAIMSAFGGHAESVERPEDLQPALKRAASSGKASCINVRVDPFAPYPTE